MSYQLTQVDLPYAKEGVHRGGEDDGGGPSVDKIHHEQG